MLLPHNAIDRSGDLFQQIPGGGFEEALPA
jgi:hypothetical protein